MKDQGWSLSSRWRDLNHYFSGECWKPPDCYFWASCVLCLSHWSISLNIHSVRWKKIKKRMTVALRSGAGRGWDCFEILCNKYSRLMTVDYLHREWFRQAHQKDLNVLVLGHAYGWVLFMSSQSRPWASGSHVSCMTAITQLLLDICSSLFCCVRAILIIHWIRLRLVCDLFLSLCVKRVLICACSHYSVTLSLCQEKCLEFR